MVFSIPEFKYDSPILQAIHINPNLFKYIEDLPSILNLPFL